MKELIKKLKDSEVTLSVDGDELVVSFDGNGLPEDFINELRSNKQKLIDFLKKSDHQDQFKEIHPVKRSESYPLSSGQQRLWVLCQMTDASLAYHMPTTVELAGDYQFDVLYKAIEATIERHEILRTVFRENEEGLVRQWVLDPTDQKLEIDHIDFSSKENPESELTSFLENDAALTFDLENGPLFRASLIKMGAERFIFFYNMHHIISDGWSLDVLGNDVMVAYQSLASGRKLDWEPLRIQYKDYSVWQSDLLSQLDSNKNKEFWSGKFNDLPPALDLPTSRLRPKLMSHNGYILETYISPELTKGLRTFSEKGGGSFFMGLLSVWNVLFYRYTGVKDVVIGTPVAGRDHVELENQIGFYLNLLALRNEVDPQEGFEDLFEKVKTNTLQCYQHQTYPFDKLVDDLQLKRDTSRSALFDVMLVLQNTGDRNSQQQIQLDHEYGEIIDKGYTGAKYDLRIIQEEIGDAMCLNINFNRDVYDKNMVENMMSHFIKLLENLVKTPNKSIASINYLKTAENQKVTVDWNQTKHPYSDQKTLVDIVEEGVEEFPDHVAIADSNRSVSYKELNAGANQLGWYLKECGIEKGDYVCLNLSRQVELVEGLLGVVKTGAAYVPFEPALPEERKRDIMNDLGVKIILTDSVHYKTTQELANTLNGEVQVIVLDTIPEPSGEPIIDQSTLSKYSGENLKTEISPNDEAYIIFTSGSTGKPKGVVVEHQPVINLIEWVNTTYRVDSNENLLMVASISFDLSVYDIFGILSKGGAIRIASHEELKNPDKLVDIIYNEQITFWDSAPAALVQLIPEILERNKAGNTGALRLVFQSGDWIPMTLPQDLKNCFEGIEVVALGGATEAVIWSNHYPVKELNSDWQSIPYGKPIWNARYYVLNEELLPCPVGVEGDLYIGGDVLAKEYKNDEELTSRKFVTDPFNPGKRMYYSGDRARFFSDGNIEFRGRLDDQVKIRGYRIEMGDVKHALEQLEDIKDAFVTTKGEKTERQLVAYFTTRDEVSLDTLKTFLSTRLPDYMIPTFMMELDAFPVTVNGKLDRKNLPEILVELDRENYVAPTTELEHKLVEIWSEILKIDQNKIGVTSSFFDLGGDSLRATMVISKVLNELKYKLDLRELFVDPTIRCISQQIEADLVIAEQGSRLVDDQNELIF